MVVSEANETVRDLTAHWLCYLLLKTVTGQGILRYINVKGLINTERRSVWMTDRL